MQLKFHILKEKKKTRHTHTKKEKEKNTSKTFFFLIPSNVFGFWFLYIIGTVSVAVPVVVEKEPKRICWTHLYNDLFSISKKKKIKKKKKRK